MLLPSNAISHWLVLILGLHPANGRRRYKVTPSLIGEVQTQILGLHLVPGSPRRVTGLKASERSIIK